MNEECKQLLVGIITNPDYNPSILAGTHIKNVLNACGIRTIDLSLDDILSDKANCDIVFNVHYGEIGDGGVMSGVLDDKGIAFVGNSQYACSLMMNKILSKMLFRKYKYLTPLFWYEPNVDNSDDVLIDNIEKKITYPLLAKPVNGAASENIIFIKDSKELFDFVAKYRFLIDGGYYFFEQFIQGRELSAGYVDAIGELLPVVEIKLKEEKYQSQKVKFTKGLKENIVPANVEQKVCDEAQQIARDLHSVFHCDSFSRTDMIYEEKTGKLYVLEINTNPGLLETSLLPLMAKTAGVSEDKFFMRLIQYSLQNG
ncbi:MAG: hypothetical protein A3C27_00205 [Candidatus Levybacteria bacterium RIFCSPHIGHO2_02_FULL_39_36]|nr:MAG: hypothetical protein A3E68_00125 [Candidatus Levybacteria bacterium RIFCSPHIGHO2_12_FULL_39_39]OGH27735.1 MAG: hypothetical protein A3C27_00205 [Candidatus Levybacteria bacterium RIFCSPHIGHO2_02_FULL_39_36]OHA32240.1 MAG: hypothetical protein A3B09_02430 [Candidatus Taylorbacteria bacterium RIFCSPLOWO2_01_FULL_43_83]